MVGPTGLPSGRTSVKRNLPSTILAVETNFGIQEQRAWFRCAVSRQGEPQFGPISQLGCTGSRILLKHKTYTEWRNGHSIAAYYWDLVTEEFDQNGWVLLRSGACPNRCLDFPSLARKESPEQLEGLTEFYLKRQRTELDASKLSPIAKMWQQILGSPIIPFDMDERRRTFKGAFEILKDYVAKHEKAREDASKQKTDVTPPIMLE